MMKKIIRYLLLLIAVLLVVIVVKTLLFKSLQFKAESINIPVFGDESVGRFSKAISIPTISFAVDAPIDSAAFSAYLNFIDESYPLIKSKLSKEVFSSYSLLYTWKGANTSLKPMILMAHMDVVPPGDTASWEKKPFSGENDGTFIWGRGSLDDKASMISILESVEKLLSEGFVPERTVMLSFGHDEELTGIKGAKTIASALKDRGVDAEYVLDEGLDITVGMVPMMKKPVALIGTSEKGYMSVRLSVNMLGGQSSIPDKESALIVLNSAVHNIVSRPMSPEISGPLKGFIRYIGPEMPFYAKAIFANKWLFKKVILNIYTGSASGNASVRTTASPTIFQSGIKDNVVPTKAEATINFRILPGTTSVQVLDHLREVINDDRVKIEILKDLLYEPAPVSPFDVQGFKNIFTVLKQIYPEVVVSPALMLASSDGKFFSVVTPNVYRFVPCIVTSEDMNRIHGLNEHIKIEDFKRGIGFYYQLIKISQ
jgi:carboxypeptidase PM20D1